jgi:hypothetical protein
MSDATLYYIDINEYYADQFGLDYGGDFVVTGNFFGVPLVINGDEDTTFDEVRSDLAEEFGALEGSFNIVRYGRSLQGRKLSDVVAAGFPSTVDFVVVVRGGGKRGRNGGAVAGTWEEKVSAINESIVTETMLAATPALDVGPLTARVMAEMRRIELDMSSPEGGPELALTNVLMACSGEQLKQMMTACDSSHVETRLKDNARFAFFGTDATISNVRKGCEKLSTIMKLQYQFLLMHVFGDRGNGQMSWDKYKTVLLRAIEHKAREEVMIPARLFAGLQI